MRLTENFDYEEFVHSDIADKYGIDNEPKRDDVKETIAHLAQVLQKIRDRLGEPIHISSGYRSTELNDTICGSVNSDHLFGAAADIRCTDNKKLFDLICEMTQKHEIHCRQIIDEMNYRWIHISINNKFNSFKTNQILHLG